MHHVLILDDSEDDLFLFSRAIEKSRIDLGNVEFIFKEDGAAALAWMKENGCPELVITDNHMIPMDGVGFVTSLKNLEGMASVPVAMWTDHTDDPALEPIKDNLVSLFNKKNFEALGPWIEQMVDDYVNSAA